MRKQQIVNLLYILAVLVMLAGVVGQTLNHEDLKMGFWLGLLIYAFAELYKARGEKEEDT